MCYQMFVNGARDSSAGDTPVLLLRRIRTQFPASTTRQLTTTYNSSPRGVRCLWTLWEPALTHTSPHTDTHTCTRSETNLCKTFFILICFLNHEWAREGSQDIILVTEEVEAGGSWDWDLPWEELASNVLRLPSAAQWAVLCCRVLVQTRKRILFYFFLFDCRHLRTFPMGQALK